MALKIAAHEVTTFRIGGPMAREAVRITVRDDAGVEASGEAAPIVGFSRETLGEVMQVLHDLGGSIDAIDDGGEAVEAVERGLARHAGVLEGVPAARFALETVLFDLIARRRGVDVATCLRGRPGVGEVETSALLRDPADEGFVARALEVVERGFRVVKVKLRAEDEDVLEREIAGLEALREVAPEVELRLDPNGRWSVEDARRRLGRLSGVRPAFVEQPVGARDLLALGKCAVPWAADESLGVAGVAERLSGDVGCAAFVLKPAALGIGRVRGLAGLARARGIPVVVTHFFDGAIGLAAACETALSLDAELLACGLDPHAGLAGLPASMLPHHGVRGRVRSSGGVGLGLASSAG